VFLVKINKSLQEESAEQKVATMFLRENQRGYLPQEKLQMMNHSERKHWILIELPNKKKLNQERNVQEYLSPEKKVQKKKFGQQNHTLVGQIQVIYE